MSRQLLLGKITRSKQKFRDDLLKRSRGNLIITAKSHQLKGYSKLNKNDFVNSLLHTLTLKELKKLPKFTKISKSKKQQLKGTGKIIKLKNKKRKGESKLPLCIKGAVPTLVNRQKESIANFLNSNINGYMISHGTGCGKTLIAVAYSQCYLQQNPNHRVIVITPASLQNNFRDGMEFYGIDWQDPRYDIFSYNKFTRIIQSDKKNMKFCNNKLIIVDEVQNLKNVTAKRAMSSLICAMGATKVLLLTATPFINRIYDFGSYINMLYQKNIIGKVILEKDFETGEVTITDIPQFELKEIKKMTDYDQTRLILNHLRGRIHYIKTCATGNPEYPDFKEHFVPLVMTPDESREYFEEKEKRERV